LAPDQKGVGLTDHVRDALILSYSEVWFKLWVRSLSGKYWLPLFKCKCSKQPTLTSRDTINRAGVLRQNIWTDSNETRAKCLLVGFMESLKHNELRSSAAGEFSVNALPKLQKTTISVYYSSVSQPPGRGPVPGPGINYTWSREVLLEFVIFSFLSNFHE